ncbi:MAG TPA: 4Fe-4S dicluster domain-containing protein [Thermoplasmata archaeon]|nr:4Fe-4S dicluster domain-containing protein [Thermoplasmata archaeon]
MIEYTRKWCKGCRICLKVCPRRVFEVEDGVDRDGYQKMIVKRAEDCNYCMLCSLLCLDLAIEVKR